MPPNDPIARLEPEEDEQRAVRLHRWLASQRYYGQVTLTVRAGRVVSYGLSQTLKPAEFDSVANPGDD